MAEEFTANSQVDQLLDDLKAHRKSLGWSQEKLAESADVSRATVVRLETPGTSVSLLSAAQLAHAMDCRIVLQPSDAVRERQALGRVQHQGVYWSRVQSRSDWPDYQRERALAQAWEQFNQPQGLSQGILPALMAASGVPLTQDVATAVATVVQWLGSDAGWGFLQAALAKAGHAVTQAPEG